MSTAAPPGRGPSAAPPGRGPSAAPPDRDPSAALVLRIADEALNPAYAQRSASGRVIDGSGRARGRRFRAAAPTIVMVALAGLLVGVLVVAARDRAAAVDSERERLVALAMDAEGEVGELTEEAASLAQEVDALREEALGSESVGIERAAQIEQWGVGAATRPVSGPGARVVLADGQDAEGAGDASTSRVLDIDLQRVVNGLWESGAEAVAINGERVGPLTSIRSRAEVILVNYTAVVSPYEVDAIGDPRSLPTDFLRSSGGEWVQLISASAGVQLVAIEPVMDERVLPGEPVAQLRYARPGPGDQQEDAA